MGIGIRAEADMRNVTTLVYRNLLRNLIRLPLNSKQIPELETIEHKAKLIELARIKFRSQKGQTNYMEIQKQLVFSTELNNGLVDFLETGEIHGISPLIECAKGNFEKIDISRVDEAMQTMTDKKVKPISERVEEKNDDQNVIISSAMKLLDMTKLDPQALDIKQQRNRLDGWIRYYIRRHQELGLIPHKSKLDKRYINEILVSQVLYKRSSVYLHQLVKKLRGKKEWHEKGRIMGTLGTVQSIAEIRTPWEEKVTVELDDYPLRKGETFNFKQRKAYDDYLVRENEFKNYYNAWYSLYMDELKWEKQIEEYKSHSVEHYQVDKTLDGQWKWVFDTYKSVLRQELSKFASITQKYNRTQKAYYNNFLKHEFQAITDHSKENVRKLIEFKRLNQIGPYTDIVDGYNQSHLISKYGFKAPTRLRLLDIE